MTITNDHIELGDNGSDELLPGDVPVPCTVCDRHVSALMVAFDGACPDCLDHVNNEHEAQAPATWPAAA